MAWYDVSASGAPIQRGDVVSLDPTQGARVVRASRAVLEVTGAPLGVALSAAAPGAAVQVAERGVVPGIITGLTAGRGGWAVVDEDARCAQTDSPGEAPILGRVLTDGSLIVHPIDGAAVQLALGAKFSAMQTEHERLQAEIGDLKRQLAAALPSPPSATGAADPTTTPAPSVADRPSITPPRATRAALTLPANATVLFGGLAHLPDVPTLPSQYTVECWLRLDAARADGLLMVLPGAYVGVDTSGRIHVNSSGAGLTSALPADTWVHVALARDTGAGRVTWTLYDPRTEGTSTDTVPAGSWLRDPSPCLGGVGGQVAELRVWSGLRTAAQIASTRRALPAAARQELLAWWPCDEGAGGVIFDRVGRAHGAAAGAGWAQMPEGLQVQHSGYTLDAPNVAPPADPPGVWPVIASGGGFLLPGLERLASARNWTVELWLRPSTVLPARTARIFEMVCNSIFGRGVLITHYANPYRHFASMAGTTTLADLTLPYDAAWPGGTTWTHVALVRALGADGAGELRAYLNGQLAKVGAFTTTGDGSMPLLPIKLGMDFDGAMAEVRAWSVARTESEIRATMRQRVTSADGLVGCWPLDDRGPTARALVGPAGVCTGATWEERRTGVLPPWGVETAGGYLLTFDRDTRVTIPDQEVLHRAGGQYTIECWIKPIVLDGSIVRKGISTVYNQEFVLGASATGRLGFYYGRRNNDMTYTYATGLLADRWHHVAVIYNFPSNRISLVVDGVETRREPANDAFRDGDFSAASLEVGVKFQGQICDLRLWRGDQLAQLDARRAQRIARPMDGLLGSWPLDDGPNAAGIIADLSGNHNHGALVGGSWSSGRPPHRA